MFAAAVDPNSATLDDEKPIQIAINKEVRTLIRLGEFGLLFSLCFGHFFLLTVDFFSRSDQATAGAQRSDRGSDETDCVKRGSDS